MIQLVPTVSTNSFKRTENEWKIIKDFLKYLNSQEEEPLLTHDNFIDMDIFDCFSFSSKKAIYMSELIVKSLDNGRLQEYIEIFNKNCDYLYSFPIHELFKFCNFSRYSNGFYCKRIITPNLI